MTTTVLQGATTTLVNQIFQYPGGPAQDLADVTIAITSADGATTVLAATSVGVLHPETGVWAYDWTIDVDQAPGGYLVTWTGTAASNPVTTTELVIVAAVPTYAAQLAAARRYDRVPYQATDAQGNPIPGAHFTLWDGVAGGAGANQVTNITALDGTPIPGGILVGDARGYAPGFLDLDKTANLYIIGSETGVIEGVDPVLIEPSDTDDRVIATEAFLQGPGGISDRVDAIETSRGEPLGLATLGADGRVQPAQLPGSLGGGVGFVVTDYGAIGDGVNDDAPAIQSVLNLVAASAPGARVIVPPGTYLIDSELEIQGPVHLDLAPGATIRRGSASMRYMIRNFNATFAPTGYNGRGNIRISGGVWDAAGDVLTGSVTAIIFAHADRIRVENLTVRNVRDWHGLELNSTQNAVVTGCTFEGFTAVAAGRTISEAVQLDLALDSGALPGIGAGAYDNTPCNNVLVTGCTVRPSTTLGSYGRMVGSHSFADTRFHTRVRIIGNNATGLGDYAVRAYNWQDAVIGGNEFFSCNGALLCDIPAGATVETEGVVFTGNICRSMGVQNGGTAVLDYAVNFVGLTSPGSLPVREGTVTHNLIKAIANGKGAIHFYNVADIICSGNILKTATGTATAGIFAEGCALGTYTGNKMDGMTDRGIQIADTTDGVATSVATTISGNTITACAAAGIDTNSTDTAITGNTINNIGGARAVAIWTNASGCSFTGNRLRKSTGTATSGVEIRNTCTFMANQITGWTAATTDTGASGQSFFVNGGTVFPTAARTYNRSA